jgi:hypothetical protein
VPPIMVVMVINILQIPLPKFHDGDDVITHIGRLAKICARNGDDNDAHKL